jgi:phosphoserine aminotransferase
MSALNLLGPEDGADFIITGVWSEKALKEAKRVSRSTALWTPSDGLFNRVPADGTYMVSSDATYVHYTTNNTIFGTQFQSTPDVGAKPLIADMSSDICSRPVDVSKHAVIYAGAQKNLGPSGVTVVILSPWAQQRSRERSKSMGGLPSMLDYGLMADKKSLFNTPNTLGIYTLERVLAWIEDQGGLESMAAQNNGKAAKLYAALDKTDFWRPHAQDGSRSRMNVTWRGPSDEAEKTFLQEADAAGLKALKGHRSVGGIRASIYNACPEESVDALVDFMEKFEKKHG